MNLDRIFMAEQSFIVGVWIMTISLQCDMEDTLTAVVILHWQSLYEMTFPYSNINQIQEEATFLNP